MEMMIAGIAFGITFTLVMSQLSKAPKKDDEVEIKLNLEVKGKVK